MLFKKKNSKFKIDYKNIFDNHHQVGIFKNG